MTKMEQALSRLHTETAKFKNSSQAVGEKAAKVKELDAQGVAYCPKCLSTSVQPIKKGLSLGRAIGGGLLLGPLGLAAGLIGKNKVKLYCMKCGNKFKAG